MEERRAANQRPAFSLSFTLALYISNGFGLRFGSKMSKVLDELHFRRLEIKGIDTAIPISKTQIFNHLN